ncbi:MAG: TatD family hydrolase [Clostridia bacterium]|nr:TatD family hydrolase [Clostridia bacterium]
MSELTAKYPFSDPLIVDTHAHYDDGRFDGIREELLRSLPGQGIAAVITCGCDGASSRAAKALAEQFEWLYFAAGIHPENIDSQTSLEEIEELLSHPKCVAVGEIGLDYYWRQDNREEQKALFEEQLRLANRKGKPVIIHDREAHGDTLLLLQKHRPRGVLHSFSGSPEMARELLKLDLYIGVGGVITFKNAKKLPEVVTLLPENRLLLETDAPYLAPVPHRGECNRSDWIFLTAQKIAELRGVATETVLRTTAQNAAEIFGISV